MKFSSYNHFLVLILVSISNQFALFSGGMANYSVPLIFFLLLHNLLLPAAQKGNTKQPICLDSFSCRDLGSLSFPFYNSVDRRCGLFKLDCSESVPTIQLGGQSYDVVRIVQPGPLLLADRLLRNQISNKNCDAIRNLNLPDTPSISFTIFPNLTLFRCSKSPMLASLMNNYFQEEVYYTHELCIEHNVYYTSSIHNIQTSRNLPPNCSVIQLPASSPYMPTNASDLFSLLTDEFNLELQVSDDCLECHRRGGLCSDDNGKFQCAYTSGAEINRGYLMIISALATIGTGIVVILVIIVICFRRKLQLTSKSILSWRKKAENYKNVKTFLKNYESLAPRRYSHSDVKKMTNAFKVELGKGGYGSVYKGTLPNGSPVAVKVLNEAKGNGEEFINEVDSISRTSHVNVVALLGFCFEGRRRSLIYEFMPNGSLEKFIYGPRSLSNQHLGWEKLYHISTGIARGLEYLHRGCNTQILHFDIKPHNILLDKDFCPKISDFGLAKLYPGKKSIVSMSGMRGTPGYIAPELFSRNFGGVSHKSDVYSYGMMVLEMVGGKRNIQVEVDRTSTRIDFPHWMYEQTNEDEELEFYGIVNEEENKKVRKMVIVSLWCIQTDPSSRPSMTRVLDMFEGSLESLQIPPKPFWFSPSRSPDQIPQP